MAQGPVKTPHAQHTRNAAEVPTAFPGDCTPHLHTPALQVHLESRNLPAPLRAVSHQFGGGLDSSETPRHLERALGYSLSLSLSLISANSIYSSWLAERNTELSPSEACLSGSDFQNSVERAGRGNLLTCPCPPGAHTWQDLLHLPRAYSFCPLHAASHAEDSGCFTISPPRL